MTSSKMKKILFRIFLVLLLLIFASWLLMPKYMQKAFIYLNPGIDDYTIFANNTVKTGTPLIWPLDKNYNKESICKSALPEFEKYKTVAFLVVKNGKLLHEEYWDNYSDSSISSSFSMAKSIVSLLVGCLVDDGKISLDDPVRKFIPELQDMKDSPITIKHLLTMSSGLDWDESYNSPVSITTKSYYGDDIDGLVTSLKPVIKPGIVHSYKACDSQLLGIIVKRVSGMTISGFASARLWQPIGAENNALWSLDKENGNEKVSCCFNATARDFARIGQMVLDSGSTNGHQVVSKKYLTEATTAASWLKDTHGKPCDYYGYQFWLTEYGGRKIIYARGILGQYIYIIPSLNMVIVRLGHKRSDEYIDNIPKDWFIYINEGIRIAGQ